MVKLPKSRRHFRMPLTRIVGLGFGAFVAIVLALVLVMSVSANFKNTFSLLNDKAILITRSMENQVRRYLDAVERAVIAIKPYFDNGSLGFDKIDEALENLSVALSSNPVLTVLVVTDLNGERYGVYKAPNGKIWPFTRDNPTSGYEMYVLPELDKDSGPVWGPLISNKFGQFANVSVPLVRDGAKIGTLTAASSLAELGLSIQNLDEGADTTNFIIANGDEVVVHSDMTGFQTGEKPAVELPAKRDALGDPVLATNAKTEAMTTFQKAAKFGIDVASVDAEGEEFIMLSVSVPGYSDQPWIVGEYIRNTSISREVRRLAGSAFVGFAALVVSVLVAVWLGKRVARPLKALAEQSEKVGNLSLSDVEPLPRSRVSELDQVAQAFNSMVEGLRAMNTYVPRSLFIKLMRLGGSSAANAREAELTILFTDIVSFTSLSQNMSAAETARHLNEHFAILVAAVEAEGGTVDKFVGDGMLAFWGAPDERPDHAEAAVRSARHIARALHAANLVASQHGGPQFHVRIGIHTGPAVVGNVGALDRWNYTVVGDTVNITDRLQSLGREIGSEEEIVILASAETVARLPHETDKTAVGSVSLRGRTGALDVWKLDPFATPEHARGTDLESASTSAAE
ncbi:adenylate/guanylate cyclase domain-containing protein [Roseibium aggregatum]|uniref:Adenylate/guanylate cyclase domain-containing protein n=1 Tax=Roseibium aggregatum TaxID=187304 RepID=A0A926NRR6_9HYPH|nr:adenylate/guanylate cyclase domain-containing protein [Roseibium aggregatum]MBD1545269.1 adenylate/guanylate cyclase domain-containing protein [Roseibium aggregatum]